MDIQELTSSEPIVDIQELISSEPIVDIQELISSEPTMDIQELISSEPIVDIQELTSSEPTVEVEESLPPEVLANVNSVWGPPLWVALHSLAELTEDVAVWDQLLTAVEATMPCPECKSHFAAWRIAHPLTSTTDVNGLTVSESVRSWLLALHNDVNRRTGRPEWTVEQLEGVYRPERVREVLGDVREYISSGFANALDRFLTANGI